MRGTVAKLLRKNAYKRWESKENKYDLPLKVFIKDEKKRFKIFKRHGEPYKERIIESKKTEGTT